MSNVFFRKIFLRRWFHRSRRSFFLCCIFVALASSLQGQSDLSLLADYKVQVSDLYNDIINDTRLSKEINNGEFPLDRYSFIVNKLLTYYENHGYPFAEISLDSVALNEALFRAHLLIEPHQFIKYDTIIIKGDLQLNKFFFRGFCAFKRGKMYQEKQVKKVSQLINSLPFAIEEQAPSVEFSNDQASLYLYLQKRKVNQFDGYVGLVPVNDQTGKIAVSGELNLALMNVLRMAESLSVHWRSTERFSQFLNVKAKFPYLLGTPFGVDGSFELDKKDTTYINMNYVVSANYSFLGMNYLKIFWDFSTSNLLPKDVELLDLKAYQRRLYGLEFSYNLSDFLYNPRRGWFAKANLAVGNYIDKSSLEEENQEIRYRLLGDIGGYIPLGNRWVIALQAMGGSIIGSHLTSNELFRLGGMHSLQGFDDRSIIASTYGFGKLELRFLAGRMTYLSAFFNGGWYDRNLLNSYTYDFPFGFGVGANFETKAGLFYLSYALGKVMDAPLKISNGKIHFGLNLKF